MRHDEFEEELRPVLAIDLARPRRQRLAAHRREEPSAVERAVDHHCDLLLRGERQQPLFDAPVGQVIGELHEVEALAPERPLHLGVFRTFRSRDAYVAHATCGLQLFQRRKMRFPVEQVVDVHQVELRQAPKPQRVLELHLSECLADGPDLGRGKKPRMRRLLEHLADDRFGIPVHG